MPRHVSHILLLVLLQASALAQPTGEPVTAEILPPESQLVSSTTVDALPDIGKRRDFFIWPSQEKMAASLKESDQSLDEAKRELANPRWLTTEKTSVIQAKRMADMWIGVILKDKWHPTDLIDRLIALDTDIDGSDAVRVRYEIDEFQIQVSQTNPEIGIVITDQKKRELTAAQLIALFFKEGEKMNEEIKAELWAGGEMGLPAFKDANPLFNEYRGHITWWSSGNTYLFHTVKFYGGAGLPMGLPKDWF